VPELPEVETVVRALHTRLAGRTLSRPQIWQPAVVESELDEFNRVTTRARVEAVRRRGKWILFDLADGHTMLAHLRMTGKFRFVATSAAREKHDHLEWQVSAPRECLRYHDVRRFGRFRIVKQTEVEAHLAALGWGPEPFDVAPAEFARRIGKSKRPIKAALLDQSVVAGLGNIYADEILFAAGIHPRTPTASIGPKRAGRMHRVMIDVLKRAIAARGTSLVNYVTVDGTPGEYRQELQVFRRQGEPCPRCGRAIRRIRIAGRSTHYCSLCQRA
jgi:formamidopyrimidine-DNA glycosylase